MLNMSYNIIHIESPDTTTTNTTYFNKSIRILLQYENGKRGSKEAHFGLGGRMRRTEALPVFTFASSMLRRAGSCTLSSHSLKLQQI